MSGLFEYLSPEEFEKEVGSTPKVPSSTSKGKRKRAVVTEPRTNTTWYALPHTMGYCECPAHDEIQAMMNPTAQVYRQKYPVRMTYEIQEGMPICRDCFVHEGDKV